MPVAKKAPAKKAPAKKAQLKPKRKIGINPRSVLLDQHRAEAKLHAKPLAATRYLTEQQRRYVLARATGMSQVASATAAGMSNPRGNAARTEKKAHVQAALAKERERFAQASQITKKKVIDGLKEAIDMAKLEADPHGMISGWREIAKLCGFYEPTKHEVKLSVEGKLQLQHMQEMSDEELLRLADEGKDVIEGEFTVEDDDFDDETE